MKCFFSFIALLLFSAALLAEDKASGAVENFTPAETATNLGWINHPQANICGGYYVEPSLDNEDTSTASTNAPKNETLNISSDSANLQQNGVSTLTGNVKATEPGRQIQSQYASFIRNAKTKKIEVMDYSGLVIVREPSRVTVGDSAHITPGTNQGIYHHVIYRMALSLQPIGLIKQSNGDYKVEGLVAHGKADQLKQTKKGYQVFTDASYSTCTPANESWHMTAKQIDLNHDTGRGKATHATIYFKSIPVFYTPYFGFPIDKRRESGFLSPTYGSSSQGGISLNLPYYWNIAPNYDMTITPTIYTLRGLLIDTKNRFLTAKSTGEVEIGAISNDQAFGNFQRDASSEYATANSSQLERLLDSSTTRWYYHLKDLTNFSPHLQGSFDYTRVSDDYIQQDFGLPSQMTGQFLQQGNLTYNATYWNAGILAQQYETLHPVTLLANANQYRRLPDITFNINYPQNSYLTYLFSGETVNFSRDLNPGETVGTTTGDPTAGVRTNVQPGISLPWNNNYSFVKPTLQWEMTEYNLSGQTVGYDTTISRSLPIFNIDSGLFFDRDTSVFGHEYDQTFEPRVYYLYVPYRSQYQIPIFDTGLQGITFSQLFQTNRFSSVDRIGDANQVSVGLSTRYLDSNSGAEKSAFGVGRIFYMKNRQVMLCGQLNCQDSSYAVGTTSPTEPASPLVGFANYQFNTNWGTNANIAWDPQTHDTNNASVNFQYKPQKNRVFNVGYNFVQYGDPYSPSTISPTDGKNNLNQLSASVGWPITQKLDGLAGWNYNVSHQHFQTYLYGLSYNTCCYALRTGLTRTFFALNGEGVPQFSRQIFLQFVLKGLGGLGQHRTMNAIGASVPGYQDTFDQNSY